MLCPRCQELIDSGRYDVVDVNVISSMLSLGSKLDVYLKDVDYVRSYETASTIVIVLKGVKSLPRQTIKQLESILEDALKKRVRIVEHSSNVSELAVQLAYPARVMFTSILWLPDGTSEVVVKMLRSEIKRLPFRLDEYAKVLSAITGKNVRVEMA